MQKYAFAAKITIGLMVITAISRGASADSMFNYSMVAGGDVSVNAGLTASGNGLVGGMFSAYGGTSQFNNSLVVDGNAVGGAGSITFSSPAGQLRYGSTIAPPNIVAMPGTATSGSISLIPYTTEMTTDSAYLAGLTANSTFDGTSFNAVAGPIADLGSAAIFDVTAADLGSAVDLHVSGTPDAIIINVTDIGNLGTISTVFNNPAWQMHAGEIIINFPNATSVTLASPNVYGTILAPDAGLTDDSNNVRGGIYTGGSLTFDSAVAISGGYTGPLPGSFSVPLPASVWTSLSLLGGLAMTTNRARRRRMPTRMG